jgi:hypothetical protein
MGRAVMAVLKFREAAEEAGAGKAAMGHAIEPGCMAVEVTEDDGEPNASLPQLPAPETIATSDLGDEARGRRCRHFKPSAAPWRGQDQPQPAASDLGRPQAGSRRVARTGRAAYRAAVVATARRLI